MNKKDRLKILEQENPWYADGLPFECTGCGGCCTGAPGYIWVSLKEIEDIASFLNLTIDAFAKKYLREVNNRYSLLERPGNFDCVFLKDKKCEIYSVRPKQCRTFPWWAQNLKDEKSWKEASLFCEGMRNNGPLVPFETIQEQFRIQESESL